MSGIGGEWIGFLSIALMLGAIYFGLHIGIALIFVSFVCIALFKSPTLAANMTSGAVSDAIQDYLFGVIPLFVMMGLFVSVSQVGRDTFDVAQWVMRRLKGGLGVATVAANAVFAAITGVSIASASVFTKVAVPEMVRHGYSKRFAVGVVAGSSVLGMLIPPSLLFILYGVLSDQSIGKMFLAGIVPGIVLALAFALMIVWMAYRRPALIGDMARADAVQAHETWRSALRKTLPIAALVAIVLGGMYSGILTPTEAGAGGAFGALVLTWMRGKLSPQTMWKVLIETGHVSVAVLFLVMAASLYSRMLALTGVPATVTELMLGSGLGVVGFMAIYVTIIIGMGCIIDAASIMVIMLPMALPIAQQLGLDLIWFGVITVIAVEIGLLTPPFGISVYTVKATLDDKTISLKDIFAGTFPFVLCMTAVLGLLIIFPALSTVLVK
jgi:C4-dicarboxylate transporter, DctM subunit